MFTELFSQKLIEGTDIISVLKKKYPTVISRVSGPRPAFDGENGYYVLSMMIVPFKEREKGLATKYILEFIKLAKKETLDIFLTPDDGYQEKDGMTKNDLIKWYKKLGFKKKRKDDFREQHTYCMYS